jgi:hypothetical protein
MNSKASEQIRILAKEVSKEKGYPYEWAYKELKTLWNKTPKDKKKTVFG